MTRPAPEERLNQFALVIYIPDPLGAFLDKLRVELAPRCNPRAHVTVLPPRPLAAGIAPALEQAREAASEFALFDIAVGEVERFPVTDVVYLELRQGVAELRRLHEALNHRGLAFEEPFDYHPHITLAQDLEAGEVERLAELARRRWSEYRGPRAFRAESMTFVQNTVRNCWIDLAGFPLGATPVVSRG